MKRVDMFFVFLTVDVFFLGLSSFAFAQEEVHEGWVKAINIIRCDLKPGTCEGSFVLHEDGKEVTILVNPGTSIERAGSRILLGAIGIRNVVRVTSTGEDGNVTASSVEVTADLGEGKRIYQTICFACHGEKGDGKGPAAIGMQPKPMDFTDTNYMRRLTDQYLFAVVKYGKEAVMTKGSRDYLGAVAMPGFGETLSPEEVNHLISYVNTFLSGPLQDGRAQTLFQTNCAVCHGLAGKGNGPIAQSIQPAPADFTDPKFMARFSDEYKTLVITKGKLGAVKAGFPTMPGFGRVLTDFEMSSVVKYIRGFAGKEALLSRGSNRS